MTKEQFKAHLKGKKLNGIVILVGATVGFDKFGNSTELAGKIAIDELDFLRDGYAADMAYRAFGYTPTTGEDYKKMKVQDFVKDIQHEGFRGRYEIIHASEKTAAVAGIEFKKAKTKAKPAEGDADTNNSNVE